MDAWGCSQMELHGVGARWKGNLHGVGARIIGWKLLTLRDDKHARHSLWVGQRRYIMHVTRHAASTESENPWSCYTYCFREREDVEPPGRHSCTKTKCMSRVFNACHKYSMHVTCIFDTCHLHPIHVTCILQSSWECIWDDNISNASESYTKTLLN